MELQSLAHRLHLRLLLPLLLQLLGGQQRRLLRLLCTLLLLNLPVHLGPLLAAEHRGTAHRVLLLPGHPLLHRGQHIAVGLALVVLHRTGSEVAGLGLLLGLFLQLHLAHGCRALMERQGAQREGLELGGGPVLRGRPDFWGRRAILCQPCALLIQSLHVGLCLGNLHLIRCHAVCLLGRIGAQIEGFWLSRALVQIRHGRIQVAGAAS
mmetsp:Transcript_32407/g.83991  ORF Transcript_32407/g.83991 Transcript_32407/m.83991 type:complete len:209 (+) Transcript_32407:599-1225(+)